MYLATWLHGQRSNQTVKRHWHQETLVLATWLLWARRPAVKPDGQKTLAPGDSRPSYLPSVGKGPAVNYQTVKSHMSQVTPPQLEVTWTSRNLYFFVAYCARAYCARARIVRILCRLQLWLLHNNCCYLLTVRQWTNCETKFNFVSSKIVSDGFSHMFAVYCLLLALC